MTKTYRDLLPDELEAIQAFAAEFGRDWKQKLSMVYWYNARIYRDRSGKQYPVLHRMRNEFGPDWLKGFRLSKAKASEDAAEFEDVENELAGIKSLKGRI